jgi:hypothetical protein
LTQPAIEDIAECAYDAFLRAAGDYLPPTPQMWDQLAPIVRQAWIEATYAALRKVGNA